MVDSSRVGTILAEFEFPVERGKISEFAKAIRNPHPFYVNKERAKEAGFPDVIMPVTFPITMAFHTNMEDAVVDMMTTLGMNKDKSVHGEIEFIQHRTIHAGEVLQCVMKVGNIYAKTGKTGGEMTFVEMSFNFYDAQKHLACEVKNIFIEKS